MFKKVCLINKCSNFLIFNFLTMKFYFIFLDNAEKLIERIIPPGLLVVAIFKHKFGYFKMYLRPVQQDVQKSSNKVSIHN